MAVGKFSHLLLDPTSPPFIENFRLAERPQSLAKKTVAIFVNSKPNSLILMELIKNRLQNECHIKDIIWREGEHICRPSPTTLIDEVASQVDIAITGTGD